MDFTPRFSGFTRVGIFIVVKMIRQLSVVNGQWLIVNRERGKQADGRGQTANAGDAEGEKFCR